MVRPSRSIFQTQNLYRIYTPGTISFCECEINHFCSPYRKKSTLASLQSLVHCSERDCISKVSKEPLLKSSHAYLIFFVRMLSWFQNSWEPSAQFISKYFTQLNFGSETIQIIGNIFVLLKISSTVFANHYLKFSSRYKCCT